MHGTPCYKYGSFDHSYLKHKNLYSVLCENIIKLEDLLLKVDMRSSGRSYYENSEYLIYLGQVPNNLNYVKGYSIELEYPEKLDNDIKNSLNRITLYEDINISYQIVMKNNHFEFMLEDLNFTHLHFKNINKFC